MTTTFPSATPRNSETEADAAPPAAPEPQAPPPRRDADSEWDEGALALDTLERLERERETRERT
jgi:hypothetical protein